MSLLKSIGQKSKIQFENILKTRKHPDKLFIIHHLASPRINSRLINSYQNTEGKNSSFVSLELPSSLSRQTQQRLSAKKIKNSYFTRSFRRNKSERGVYESKEEKPKLINEKQLSKLKQMLKSMTSTPHHSNQLDWGQSSKTFLKNIQSNGSSQSTTFGNLLERSNPSILILRQSLNRSRYDKSNLQSKFIHSGSRRRQALLRTSENFSKKKNKLQSSCDLTFSAWLATNNPQ